MSSDQRPGKVRVFSSGANGDVPRRRRSDREDGVVRAAPPPAGPAPSGAGKTDRSLLLLILFLLGCALGGILLAWFNPIPGKMP